MSLWNWLVEVFNDLWDWLTDHVPELAIGVVVALVLGIIGYVVVDDYQWKNACRAKGGHVITTHGDSETCVDSGWRVIEP